MACRPRWWRRRQRRGGARSKRAAVSVAEWLRPGSSACRRPSGLRGARPTAAARRAWHARHRLGASAWRASQRVEGVEGVEPPGGCAGGRELAELLLPHGGGAPWKARAWKRERSGGSSGAPGKRGRAVQCR